jgi:hypothetical protein
MDKIVKSKIKNSMSKLLDSKSPFVATEAARVLCAVEGIYVSESSTNLEKPSKVTASRVVAKQYVFEELQRKGEARRNQNRKQYLKRKAKVQSEQEQRTQSESRSEAQPEDATRQEQPELFNLKLHPPTQVELAAFADENRENKTTASPKSLQSFIEGKRHIDQILWQMKNP